MQKRAVKQEIPDHSEEAKPGMQPATQRNRELRIREIIDAARQVLQEDGYARFATRRVADRVGITHGNLQYYFRTTEDLLRTALSAYVSQVMEDYTAIASQPGIGAAQRCSALISRIFQNINETDLPKFMVELWAFAWHEAYVAELVKEMQARFRSIFVKLLSELHPTLTSEECLVRAVVIGAQVDGMTIFASHGAYPGRDYIEFVRVAKRAVKMIVSASPQVLKCEAPLRRSRTDAHGSSDAQGDGLGSDGYLQSRLLGLRVPQPAQDAFYYRPTAQGKRREVKINEIVSTAANLLATEGYANFTLARVAKELGILPSALQNYFPTFDDLLRTTMGALGQVYLEGFAEIGKPSGKPALERLCEIATLFEDSRDLAVYRLWSELWALAQHSDITREIVRNGYAAYRVVCADLIREIDSSATARECLARATLIAALVDGAFVLNFSAQNQPVSMDRVFELILAITVRVAHGQIATSDAA
ncbi:TetR/AcrR family transcriptional regulator [Burkholderia sp. Ac-20353]|uniref:TetR family transcriptional regulator n=1 Tax=Burkholderia sp. Ac-20353 TaxID=2703894 RepID=UPI00197B751A|nr:TetR/AcrR family transcriptional regulator [Burkholderia sp. Ac-20353]